ncbi:MAG: hypothetical protein MRERC_1c176 [Mycoplasmataceae bacterium RC_NB112A]|nr:MAG: hypothetical protein MRERC_1c176 [Mycoplasmataceae bacterium RC_NB112A]
MNKWLVIVLVIALLARYFSDQFSDRLEYLSVTTQTTLSGFSSQEQN